MSEIDLFDFEAEFLLETIESNSGEDHKDSTIANFQGFPLVLGGVTNAKLELFDTSRKLWERRANYPYADRLYKIL